MRFCESVHVWSVRAAVLVLREKERDTNKINAPIPTALFFIPYDVNVCNFYLHFLRAFRISTNAYTTV